MVHLVWIIFVRNDVIVNHRDMHIREIGEQKLEHADVTVFSSKYCGVTLHLPNSSHKLQRADTTVYNQVLVRWSRTFFSQSTRYNVLTLLFITKVWWGDPAPFSLELEGVACWYYCLEDRFGGDQLHVDDQVIHVNRYAPSLWVLWMNFISLCSCTHMR